MSQSLRSQLYEAIKVSYPKELSLYDVFQLCNKLNFKQSNAERRLRELRESGLIERVKPARVVIGYKWIPQEGQENKTNLKQQNLMGISTAIQHE